MKRNKIILLLSGEISSGKSTLCENLEREYGFTILRSKSAISKIAEENHKSFKSERASLQKFGESLDKKTNGEWLRNFYQRQIIETDLIIVDAVRIEPQIFSFRKSYGQYVFHIHLKAPPDELYKRFVRRRETDLKENKIKSFYQNIKNDKTERNVASLENNADLVIDTSKNRPMDVCVRVAGFLGLFSPTNAQLVDVIIGGQFGSEGKGQVAAYLSPNYDCLVRVGGPNAGHKVFKEPEPQTFHILPSGSTKNVKAKLIIGPGAVINIQILLNEIEKFEVDPSRIIIDKNATIISPEDIEFEKASDKIGSTAQGVGKATAENIINRLKEIDKFKASQCKELKPFIGSSHEELEKLMLQNKKILLEGTQGTHLSLHHGLFPYTTSRDTTATGCLAEAGIAIKRVRKIIMVTRTYPIRVQNPPDGTSGDFLSDQITLEELHKRSNIPLSELQRTEKTSTTNRTRRIAEFSWALFRKSCELNSPTDIALTFSDYLTVKNQGARRFDRLTTETIHFIEELERCSGVPVSLIATRFSYRSIIDRRNWS